MGILKDFWRYLLYKEGLLGNYESKLKIGTMQFLTPLRAMLMSAVIVWLDRFYWKSFVLPTMSLLLIFGLFIYDFIYNYKNKSEHELKVLAQENIKNYGRSTRIFWVMCIILAISFLSSVVIGNLLFLILGVLVSLYLWILYLYEKKKEKRQR